MPRLPSSLGKLSASQTFTGLLGRVPPLGPIWQYQLQNIHKAFDLAISACECTLQRLQREAGMGSRVFSKNASK